MLTNAGKSDTMYLTIEKQTTNKGLQNDFR